MSRSEPSPGRRSAVALCPRGLSDASGKVTHGLVRGSDRFALRAVVDPDRAGEDAGVIVTGSAAGIPVVATLDAVEGPVEVAIVGIAPFGGAIDPELRALILGAIARGWDVINGLHHFLADDPEIVARAAAAGVSLTDIRRPPRPRDLHYWSGAVRDVDCPIIAVLGTDCALGKRTTARLLVQGLRRRGLRAHMIFTGQTGWLQDGGYGFVLDSTPNDFVCGELEHALVSCHARERPDVMVIEGQSALRHPSGPCGAELLVSGAATAVVLQHGPERSEYTGWPGHAMPSLASEVALIGAYGVPVWAVTVNAGEGFDLAGYAAETEGALGLPVVHPLRDPERLVEVVARRLERP